MSAFRMKGWVGDRIEKMFGELEGAGGEIYDVKKEEKFNGLRRAAIFLLEDFVTEEPLMDAIDFFLPRMDSYASVYCTATMQGRNSMLFGVAKEIMANAIAGVKAIFIKAGVNPDDHKDDERVILLNSWWETAQHDKTTQKAINGLLSDLRDLRKAHLEEEYQRQYHSAFPTGAITL